jgi:RimJ/RimL family protein N-acetyltransferase
MIEVALQRVPDDPWRVDTRGMLLSGRAEVIFPEQPESAADGFVVSIADAALVSIVGRPPRALILDVVRGLDGHLNVLCQPRDTAHVAGALTGWSRTTAVLQTLSSRPLWDSAIEEDTRIFSARDAPPLDHLPPPLRREIANALNGRPSARFVPGELPDRDVPPALESTLVAAAWAGRLPVSFCYPALRTEHWWDISIETLEDYRRRGYAARAVRAMTRQMWQTGRSPVWGATLDNTASLAVARSLGFQEVGRLTVFSGETPS